MASDDGEILAGGWQTDVTLDGDVVHRSPKPQSATVIRLLEHLHRNDFTAAPEPIDGGFAPDGRERLRYIAGESPQPSAWSNEAIHEVGRMLRRLHETASDFAPGPSAVWQDWFAGTLPGANPVIGHGDLGPWNILARDGLPVAFIDWDHAGPVDASWEVAQAAWLNCQLHDDDVADLNELPSPADRARQLALFLDGYELDRERRGQLVDQMIEFAVRSARDEAITHAVGPDTASPAPDGFPVLWGVTWRARAAAWMLDHRGELLRAIGD